MTVTLPGVRLLGSVGLAIGIGIGCGAIANGVSSPVVQEPSPIKAPPGGDPRMAGGQRINDPAATAPGYQRNARGQTFGSAADAARPDLEPDLIWVITREGGSGYVLKRDLDGPSPNSPAEAQALSSEAARGRIVIAYAADGTTRVGTFEIGGSGTGPG